MPWSLAAMVCAFVLAAAPASADVFVLRGGGHVEGDLLNPSESSRRQYIVRIAEGSKVTLDAAQVSRDDRWRVILYVRSLQKQAVEAAKQAATPPPAAAQAPPSSVQAGVKQ